MYLDLASLLVRTPHEADADTLRELKLRSFASRGELHGNEFDGTPIGVAFLEFNSVIGIPADVWIMITTAYVQCKTCHLIRTFPTHRIRERVKQLMVIQNKLLPLRPR